MKLPTAWCCVVLLACIAGPALAQDEKPPPQGTSRGENFSAKPPAQLFASDCTGSGCHKGPQGLAKGKLPGMLTGFLREHYTNSRESAASLANYLAKIPSGPEPREARTPRSGRPPAAIPGNANWGAEGGIANEPKPPNEARTPRHPNSRASRAAARPEEEPAAMPALPPVAAPPAAEPAASARVPRGRPSATAAVPEPEAAAAPPPPPPPAPPPAPPKPKQYDIFD
jgi:hypothetical protein